MTIADGCFAASCMIAEHMARQCHSQRDLHLSSKLVDALFKLQEVERSLLMILVTEDQVYECSNHFVVNILLVSIYGYDETDVIDEEEYVRFLVSICQVNQRLKNSFVLFQTENDPSDLEPAIGNKSIRVLDQVCAAL